MDVPQPIFLDGHARGGHGEAVTVHDPSTGLEIGSFASADGEDVARAVGSAAAAFHGWSDAGAWERARLCRRAGALIRDSRDRLIELDVHDAGLPVRVAEADVEAAARYFEYYAGVAENVTGETLPGDRSTMSMVLREPWGVCAIVLPFNLPLQLAARDLAPALAMGNAVVVKPAEQAPYGPLALLQLLAEAGVPPGVANATAGPGATGRHLVEHPAVDHITFTGSHRTGREIMAVAAERIVPTTIELGGKSPHVVFSDADLDAATRAIVAGCMPAAGQACSAGTRVLVERGCRAELSGRLAAAVEALSVGPAERDPDVGPLISERQRQLVRAAVASAVEDGARVLTTGVPAADSDLGSGYFMPPTLLDEVTPEMAAAREEIFGPVVALLEFRDEAEALAIANETDHGLVAGVWTRDIGRALRLARRLRAGQVYLNGYAVGGGAHLPFGGYKRSGIGRVKGVAGALEYTQLKTVSITLG